MPGGQEEEREQEQVSRGKKTANGIYLRPGPKAQVVETQGERMIAERHTVLPEELRDVWPRYSKANDNADKEEKSNAKTPTRHFPRFQHLRGLKLSGGRFNQVLEQSGFQIGGKNGFHVAVSTARLGEKLEGLNSGP